MDTIKLIKILLLCAILSFGIKTFSDNKADVDLWGNVGFVRCWPWNSHYLYSNTYSFTEPNHSWINHEWLGELFINKSYNLAGGMGLILYKMILGFLLLTLFIFSVKKLSINMYAGFIWLILILSVIGYGYSTRPHHFTYLLYATFLYLLRFHSKEKKILFILPLLFFLWANLHGAFFIGMIVVIIHILGSLLDSSRDSKGNISFLVILFFAMLIISFVNPYGIRLWDFIFKSSAMTRAYLSEWAPFNPMTKGWVHLDFIALSFLLLISIIFSKKSKPPVAILLLLLTFFSAVFMRRNIPIFAITCAFYGPEYFDDLCSRILKKTEFHISRQLTVAFLLFFIIVNIFSSFFLRKLKPFDIEVSSDKYPISVVKFIKINKLSGNALVQFDWAEMFIMKLYPDVKVFMDGRFLSAYSKSVINDFFDFIYARNNKNLALNSYPVDMVVIDKRYPCYRTLLNLDEWELIYTDKNAALFLKKKKYATFINEIIKGRCILPAAKDLEIFSL